MRGLNHEKDNYLEVYQLINIVSLTLRDEADVVNRLIAMELWLKQQKWAEMEEVNSRKVMDEEPNRVS